MRPFVTALFALTCSAATAQDMMIFDPSTFGDIVLPQLESGVVDYELEAQIGSYNNEFISNYGPKSIFAKAGRAVGRLDILTDVGHAPCTAFLVAENRVITNYHCVPGILQNQAMVSRGATAIISVLFQAGFVKDGVEEGTKTFHVDPEPLETSKDLDYALLQVVGDANAEFGALELSTALPGDRDPLWVIGHPMGEAQRISREKCAAAEPALDGGRLRHTCDTLPGNSGSPVIDAGLQKVVALHHAGARASSINFAFPMAEIIAQSGFLSASTKPDGGADASEELAALRRQLEEAREAQRKAEAAQLADRKRLAEEMGAVAKAAEQARLAREKAEAAEKAERERLSAEMAAMAKAAEEARLARDKAEAERLALAEARRRAGAEKLAQERAEAERLAREKSEALARDETERKALEATARAEAERLTREKAERARVARGKAEAALSAAVGDEDKARSMYDAAVTLDKSVRELALLRIIRQYPGTKAAALARKAAGLRQDESIVFDVLAKAPFVMILRDMDLSVAGRERVVLSPDGQRVAVSHRDSDGQRRLTIWYDLLSGQAPLRTAAFGGQTAMVQGMVFSPDARLFAAGDYDNLVRVFDSTTGRRIATLRGHRDGIGSIVFTLDGRHLVTSSSDRTVRLWEVRSGRQIWSAVGAEGAIRGLQVSRDGTMVAGVGRGDVVRFWNLSGGQLKGTIVGSGDLRSLAFSPDGTRIVTGAKDGQAAVWDLKTGERLLDLEGHGGWVEAVNFSDDGARIVTGDNTGALIVWNAKSGKTVVQKEFGAGIVSVDFSTDGERLHVLGGKGKYSVYGPECVKFKCTGALSP